MKMVLKKLLKLLYMILILGIIFKVLCFKMNANWLNDWLYRWTTNCWITGQLTILEIHIQTHFFSDWLKFFEDKMIASNMALLSKSAVSNCLRPMFSSWIWVSCVWLVFDTMDMIQNFSCGFNIHFERNRFVWAGFVANVTFQWIFSFG